MGVRGFRKRNRVNEYQEGLRCMRTYVHALQHVRTELGVGSACAHTASSLANLQSSKRVCLFLRAVHVFCKHRPLCLLIKLSDTNLINLGVGWRGRGRTAHSIILSATDYRSH